MIEMINLALANPIAVHIVPPRVILEFASKLPAHRQFLAATTWTGSLKQTISFGGLDEPTTSLRTIIEALLNGVQK